MSSSNHKRRRQEEMEAAAAAAAAAAAPIIDAAGPDCRVLETIRLPRLSPNACRHLTWKDVVAEAMQSLGSLLHPSRGSNTDENRKTAVHRGALLAIAQALYRHGDSVTIHAYDVAILACTLLKVEASSGHLVTVTTACKFECTPGERPQYLIYDSKPSKLHCCSRRTQVSRQRYEALPAGCKSAAF
jgi:hypothetical protein